MSLSKTPNFRILWALFYLAAWTVDVAAAPNLFLKKSTALESSNTRNGVEAHLWLDSEGGVMHLTADASANARTQQISMSSKVKMWKPLLENAFKERGRRPDYLVTVGRYDEFAARVATTAVSSGRWDLKTGQPHAGTATDQVKSLIVQHSLFPEVSELFASLGYTVSVHSVENVILGKWLKPSSTYNENPAAQAVVPTNAVVPCGESIVFKITASDH